MLNKNVCMDFKMSRNVFVLSRTPLSWFTESFMRSKSFFTLSGSGMESTPVFICSNVQLAPCSNPGELVQAVRTFSHPLLALATFSFTESRS